ncbi:hypothetical protein DFH27DRAFT_284816 [Peziza echinospora]|nr:hypothetical protein DFH27DRAFT_284816 [Peziza echinospora]
MRSIEQKPLDLQFGRPQSSISLVKIKDVAQSMYSCFVANTTDPDYEIYLGSFTSSNCAGLSPQSLFAYSSLLAKLPDDANKFLEFDYTRNIFERVYKSLFALAMAAKMGNIAANPPKEIVTDAVSLTVIVESSFRGFRPNKIWTRLGQGILALLTILVSVLGIVLWKRNLALEGEPNTLSEALHLLANSTTLRKKLTGAEYSSRSELREGLRREAAYMRFRAVLKPGKGTMVEVSNIAHDNAAAKELGIPQPHVNIVETGGPKKLFLDNLQWQLKKRYNTLLIIAVAGMGTCLAIAAMYLQRLDGLPTIGHSTSSIKYKVVYTYLPFVVSNALSPVIASLARMHCMIAPYLLLKQARRSRWHASRSSRFLGLDLDGLPPQLQFFRALKFRQFAIAGLSVAFVLSNVLSITMTSLFSPISRDVVLTAPMLNVPLPAIDEPNMVPGVVATALLRNLTGSTFATTWTTPEYYVLPFKPQSLEPGSRTYTGETLGIGAKVQCTEFPISFWQSGFKKNTTDSKISEKGFGYIAANVAWDIDVSIQFDLATPAKFPATTTYWPNYTNPAVGLRTEYTNTDYMALGWIEWPGNPTPGIPPPAPPITNRTTPGSEKLAPYFKNNWDTVGITCRAEHRASRLLATVDVGTLKILNYTVLREINQGEVQAMADKIYYLFVAPNLKQTIMSAIWKDALYQGLFENCSGSTAQMCAVNYLLAKMDPGIARKLTNDSFVPDVKVAPRVMEDMLQRVIVLSLRLYKFFNETTSPGNSTVKTGTTRLLKERQDSTTTTTQSNTNNQWRLRNSLNAAEPDEWLVSEVDGTVVTSIEKVSVAKPMLYISAAVLAYIFVILVYRMWVRQTMLGHLPTSLAETWAVLYATDAIGGGAEYSEGNGVDRGDAFEEERWMGVVKGKKIVHPVELRRRKFTGTYAYGEFYKRGGGIGGGGRGERRLGGVALGRVLRLDLVR